MRLRERVAIITGAGSGIGRATAIVFAREGARVVVADMRSEAGNETAKMISGTGGEAIFVQVDVTSASEIQRMVEFVVDRYEKIDILVNNAGVRGLGTVLTTTEEQWDSVIATNLKGVFLCSKMVIREMGKTGGGIIVNVASESGIVGEKNSVAYNASKAGVVILTKCMALDHAADNIRVNCVCPGQTLTPMLENTIRKSGDPDRVLKDFQSLRPVRRLGKPEEIAGAILYLASEEAGYVIGSTLVIDGGYTAQ